MDEILSFLGGVIAFVAAALGGLIPHFGPAETVFYGYVEADYVYVAPASAGTIEAMLVSPGDVVAAGAALFELDNRTQRAGLASARARLAGARAQLDNAQTGRRAEELAITERALERAKSDLELASQNHERTARLFEQAVVARARLDQDQAALMAAQSAVDELEAQLTVGRLPARPAELEAARADVAAAEAEVDRLSAMLADRTAKSLVAGVVDEVYFAVGEQAGPATPVVSILPDAGLEVRFFVTESERHALAPGVGVTVTCKGCGEPVMARIAWLASDAQFNPPIIYSRQERDELVFLVKARPEAGTSLRPGQPVEVRPVP